MLFFSHFSNSPHKNYRSLWLVYKQMWPSATLQSPSCPKRGMKRLISDCGWYATPDESIFTPCLSCYSSSYAIKPMFAVFSNPLTFCFSTLSKAHVLSKADWPIFSKSGKGHYICALPWPRLSHSTCEEDVWWIWSAISLIQGRESKIQMWSMTMPQELNF